MNIIQKYHTEHRQAYAKIMEKRSKHLANMPEYLIAKRRATENLCQQDCFTYLALREQIASIENEADERFGRLRALMLLSVTADALIKEFREFLDLNASSLPNLQHQYNTYTVSYGHADERLYKRTVDTALLIQFDKSRIIQFI